MSEPPAPEPGEDGPAGRGGSGGGHPDGERPGRARPSRPRSARSRAAGSRRPPSRTASAVTLIVFLLLVTLLVVLARQQAPSDHAGDGSDGAAGTSPMTVYVHPAPELQARDYAVWGTLVRGGHTIVWSRRLAVGKRVPIEEVTLGRYVLSVTVAPCERRRCSAIRGGSAIGLVTLERGDRIEVDVRVECHTRRAVTGGTGDDVARLDCTPSEVTEKRSG